MEEGNRNASIRKYIMLILSCILIAANYFAFSTTMLLQKAIIVHFNLSQEEYVILYAMYSIPNIILVLLFGLLVDYIGHKSAHLFIGFLIPTSQLIAYISITINNYPLALLSRLLLGYKLL